MAEFEITDKEGRTYQVTAPTAEAAHAAIFGGAKPDTGLAASIGAGAATGLVAAATEMPVAAARLATKAVEKATGKDFGIDWNYWSPSAAFDQMAMPEHNPDHETARNLASIAAPVAVGGGLTRYLSNPVSSGVGDLAKSAAIMGGSSVGGQVGEAVGGDFGREVGSMVGGSLAAPVPGMAARGVQKGVNRAFAAPNSKQLLADADLLGVRPSIGLIGNKRASDYEDAFAAIPIVDMPSRAVRAEQNTGMAKAADDIAGRVRAMAPRNGALPNGSLPSPNNVIDKGTLGFDATSLAERARGAVRDEKSAIQEDIIRVHPRGAQTPIIGGHQMLTDQMTRMRQNPGMGESVRQAIDPLIAELRSNKDAVADTALEAQLQQQLQLAKGAGDKNAIAAVQQAIANNRDISIGAVKDASSSLGRRMENGASLPAKVQGPIRALERRLMRLSAQRHGMPPQQFDAIQARTRDLFGEEGALDKGLRADPGEKSYGSLLNSGKLGTATSRAMFGDRPHPSTSAADREALAVQQRNLLGDLLEYRLLGDQAGGLRPKTNPADFQPRVAHEGWADLTEEARNTIAPQGTEARTRADALSRLTGQDYQRPTRATPGRGGNTFGLPTRLAAMVGAAAAAPWAFTEHLAIAAPAVALAYGVPRAFTSERFARYAVQDPVPVTQGVGRDIARAAPAVVGNVSLNENRRSRK